VPGIVGEHVERKAMKHLVRDLHKHRPNLSSTCLLTGMQDNFVELDLETDADFEADPESLSEDWMYTEHMIYMPVCLCLPYILSAAHTGDPSILFSSLITNSLWKHQYQLKAQP
jgi:hypothetical protein